MAEVLHQRAELRAAVVAALKAGSTSAGARVFDSRMVPYQRIGLPAVGVYVLSETSDDQQTAPRELKRSAQLIIEAVLEQTDDVDDELDALALQVERAMHADPTFGNTCSDSTLASCELSIGEAGNRPIGLLRLTYKTTYYTGAPEAADVGLDDFKTADITTSLGGLQATADQSHDTVSGLSPEVTP